MPAVTRLMIEHPDVKVEVSIDQKLIDLVAERYDAGVRLGEQVEKDMIAVRIGPELQMTVVGSPAYFAKHPKPQTPHDLTQHVCIRLGVREEWSPAERAGRGPVHLQQRSDDRSRSHQRSGARLSS